MTEQQREAFERWYNAEYVRPIIPADRTEGGYQHPDAQSAWDAWRAALSHAEGEAVPAGYLSVLSDGTRIVDTRQQYDAPEVWPLYTHPAPQVAVPEGYALVPVEPTEAMLHAPLRFVERPHHTAVADSRRRWAEMLAAAPTAPAGEAEFHVEHKTLRSAMAYVGIAAPESDEELGAEMAQHAKRVIRAAAKALSQQPVSDPDGLADNLRMAAQDAAEVLTESAKLHRRRGLSSPADACDRCAELLRDLLSAPAAPAPDERDQRIAELEDMLRRLEARDFEALDKAQERIEELEAAPDERDQRIAELEDTLARIEARDFEALEAAQDRIADLEAGADEREIAAKALDDFATSQDRAAKRSRDEMGDIIATNSAQRARRQAARLRAGKEGE